MRTITFTLRGKTYGINHCKVSGIGGNQQLIRFREFTFIYTEDNNMSSFYIARAPSVYLRIEINGILLVEEDLSASIGQTFELTFPVSTFIRSICDEKGLRIKNIYYDKITKEIVIQTE